MLLGYMIKIKELNFLFFLGFLLLFSGCSSGNFTLDSVEVNSKDIFRDKFTASNKFYFTIDVNVSIKEFIKNNNYASVKITPLSHEKLESKEEIINFVEGGASSRTSDFPIEIKFFNE